MKVLALGGAGDMGRMAVAILLESPRVTSITVADIDEKRATTFVELVDSPKLKLVQIDINEKDKLLELMRSHDVIMNTVGPFYKFEIPIVEAAIEAKKPYLDICDDWKPTLDALRLDKKAKSAEITAIIGIGASPGITNIMAAYACSKLEEVEDLITAWGESIEMKEGKKPKYYITPKKFYKKLGTKTRKASAALVHMLYETLGKIPTFLDGELVEIEALTEANPLQFPGYRDTYVCHIGHPEPITLPRVINAKNVSNLMFIGKTATSLARKYKEKITNKELSVDEAADKLNMDWRALEKKARMGRSPLKEYIGVPPTLLVIAIGKKEGKRKKVGVALGINPYGEMAGVTGVPLAIATIMLIEGKITKKGIITPEEAFNSEELVIELFDRLGAYCGKGLRAKDILIERIIDS